MHKSALLTVALLVCSCGTSTPPTLSTTDALAQTGCDPLVPQHCGFPFPSNAWLVPDATTPTGHHVQFGPQTLPVMANNATDPTPWQSCDGFSPGTAALTYMPGATGTGLADPDHIALSLTPTSPTILLNTATGALVPHIAELDIAASDPAQQALLIHPAIRLDDNTRYIVAVRHIVDSNGAALPPSPAFAALRDGLPFADASIERRRPLYADLFARLQQAGVGQADLQLAWDYSTASRQNNTRSMLAIRDAALALVGDAGPSYTIPPGGIIDNPNPHVRRRILGTMHVPLFLDQPNPQGKQVLDTYGLPAQNGYADYPFLVQIPNSVVNSGVPGAILQNGHGLLGAKEEGQDGYMATIIDEKGYVEIAVDLVGFAHDDVNAVIEAVSTNIGSFKYVADRQQQGLLNHLMAVRMMKGSLWKDPAVQFNGKSTIDPTHCYYRGDSQGGIMGTTIVAISTDVTRGLLGEPGMPYNLLLNRSEDFTPYFNLIRSVTQSPLDIQLALGAVQMFWDRSEPDGYAPYLTDNPLPGTPPHNVLLNLAIGDHQVTTLGAHVLARTIKAQNLQPVNREIFGIGDASAGFTGNGMTEWNFGLPPAPLGDLPMTTGDDPHDSVRQLPSSIDETDTFLRSGVIQSYCSGACQGQFM